MFSFINWPISLLVTGGVLGILILAFFWFFGISVRHWFRLKGILVSASAFEERTPPGEFKKLFAKDKRLAHLWSEYQDSLHIQREERDGQMQVVAVRSTVPAEAYFNNQYVVDSRLGTDFFKHLPG
ncbi:MAG: tellurium resistance protein TerC, partial [Polaromonas sp.]|nr:tellurium resistance protein TerC [Polaromonas sp.]